MIIWSLLASETTSMPILLMIFLLYFRSLFFNSRFIYKISYLNIDQLSQVQHVQTWTDLPLLHAPSGFSSSFPGLLLTNLTNPFLKPKYIKYLYVFSFSGIPSTSNLIEFQSFITFVQSINFSFLLLFVVMSFNLYSWVPIVYFQQQRTLHPKFCNALFCQSKPSLAQKCAQSVLWPPYPSVPEFLLYYTSFYFNSALLALTFVSKQHVSALGPLHWLPVFVFFFSWNNTLIHR